MILNVNTKPNSSGVPVFTYTGRYEIVDDNNNTLTDLKTKNWKIRFLTSGELTFTKLKGATKGIDVFLVGGGGKGGNGGKYGSSGGTGGGGGGGGNAINDFFCPGISKYTITIGGSATNTTAFGFTAKCGNNGSNGSIGGTSGGAGGTGSGKGGTGGHRYQSGVNGGKGGNGVYEFGEAGALQYGGGGGGGAGAWFYSADDGYYSAYGTTGSGGSRGGGAGGFQTGSAGTANTGGGGGGGGWNGHVASNTHFGGAGGSGIVVIRNTRANLTELLWEDAPFSGTVNATDSLNVRNIPSSTASGTKVNGTLAYQREVKIHDLSLDTDSSKVVVWAKIQESDISGWCNLDYLTISAKGIINKKQGATIYSTASSEGTVVAILPFNTTLTATEFVSGNNLIWVKITATYKGASYNGYILREHINFSGN